MSNENYASHTQLSTGYVPPPPVPGPTTAGDGVPDIVREIMSPTRKVSYYAAIEIVRQHVAAACQRAKDETREFWEDRCRELLGQIDKAEADNARHQAALAQAREELAKQEEYEYNRKRSVHGVTEKYVGDVIADLNGKLATALKERDEARADNVALVKKCGELNGQILDANAARDAAEREQRELIKDKETLTCALNYAKEDLVKAEQRATEAEAKWEKLSETTLALRADLADEKVLADQMAEKITSFRRLNGNCWPIPHYIGEAILQAHAKRRAAPK